MSRELFLFVGAVVLCAIGLFIYSRADDDDERGLVPLGIVIAVIGLFCVGYSYYELSQTLPSGVQREASK